MMETKTPLMVCRPSGAKKQRSRRKHLTIRKQLSQYECKQLSQYACRVLPATTDITRKAETAANFEGSFHTDNSAASQRSIILRHLQMEGSLTTLQARRMGICHPSMRCLELRKAGYPIVTHWTTDVTQDGSLHRVALYILDRKKQLSLPGMEGAL